MKYLYLFLVIGSFSIPFLYSFEKKMRFIRWWRSVFTSIIIVAIPFIIWDIIFTRFRIWGFNDLYHLNLDVFGLPLEEILFFICIPYASIFTHYAIIYFFKDLKLPSNWTRIITIVFLIFSVLVLILNYPKYYTTVTFSIFIGLLIYSLIVSDAMLSRFYITFIIILIPFFLVNGTLTGSFIQEEVVWYNNFENMGFRIGTVPFEDLFYAFNLLYLNLIVIEKLKPKFTK